MSVPRLEYHLKEPTEPSSPSTDRAFVVDTCVMALNFAWWSYLALEVKEKPSFLHHYEEHIIVNEPLELRCHIHYSDDNIVVAFRGSKTRKNYVTDAQARSIGFRQFHHLLRPHLRLPHSPLHPLAELESLFAGLIADTKRIVKCAAGTHIHSGFARALSTVYPEALAVVAREFNARPRKIVVCGHSLGGALAHLFALSLRTDLPAVVDYVSVYTFGSPRVGNRHFTFLSRNLLSRCWRVVVSGDLISKLPPWPYVHCPTEVLLAPSGDLFLDPSVLENIVLHQQKSKLVRHRIGSYAVAFTTWAGAHPRTRCSVHIWPCFHTRIDETILHDFRDAQARQAMTMPQATIDALRRMSFGFASRSEQTSPQEE